MAFLFIMYVFKYGGHACTRVCGHVFGTHRPMLSMFLNFSPPYLLRQSLSLKAEMIN